MLKKIAQFVVLLIMIAGCARFDRYLSTTYPPCSDAYFKTDDKFEKKLKIKGDETQLELWGYYISYGIGESDNLCIYIKLTDSQNPNVILPKETIKIISPYVDSIKYESNPQKPSTSNIYVIYKKRRAPDSISELDFLRERLSSLESYKTQLDLSGLIGRNCVVEVNSNPKQLRNTREQILKEIEKLESQ